MKNSISHRITPHPAMPAYPGTEENSWWTAVGCTLLAIAAVSSETAQRILPDDFTSHVLGCLAWHGCELFEYVEIGCDVYSVYR